MANTYNPRRIRVIQKEEAQYKRRMVVSLSVAGVLLLIIFFGGIPFILSAGNFFNALKDSPQQSSSDTTPLLAPRLEPINEATNSSKLAIDGFGQEGATVSLFVNDQKTAEQLISKSGEFSFSNVALKEGQNRIYAQITSATSQESPSSTALKIMYDKTPPVLEVTSPQDNQTLQNPKELRIIGKSDPEGSVLVNNTIATMDPDGKFSASLPVTPQGERVITLLAEDIAGNQTTKEIKVIISQ